MRPNGLRWLLVVSTLVGACHSEGGGSGQSVTIPAGVMAGVLFGGSSKDLWHGPGLPQPNTSAEVLVVRGGAASPVVHHRGESGAWDQVLFTPVTSATTTIFASAYDGRRLIGLTYDYTFHALDASGALEEFAAPVMREGSSYSAALGGRDGRTIAVFHAPKAATPYSRVFERTGADWHELPPLPNAMITADEPGIEPDGTVIVQIKNNAGLASTNQLCRLAGASWTCLDLPADTSYAAFDTPTSVVAVSSTFTIGASESRSGGRVKLPFYRVTAAGAEALFVELSGVPANLGFSLTAITPRFGVGAPGALGFSKVGFEDRIAWIPLDASRPQSIRVLHTLPYDTNRHPPLHLFLTDGTLVIQQTRDSFALVPPPTN
jgi:hypothetical protein